MPLKRYYSSLIQKDVFLSKLIPLFFLFSFFIKSVNWWKLSYFFNVKSHSKNILKKNKFLKKELNFTKKRYSLFIPSKFVFNTEDNVPIFSLFVSNRKVLWRNVYFSKLWILRLFGWTVLKFNILTFKKKFNTVFKKKKSQTGYIKKIKTERDVMCNKSNKALLFKNIILCNIYNSLKANSFGLNKWF